MRGDCAKEFALAREEWIDQRHDERTQQLNRPNVPAPSELQAGLEYVEAGEAHTLQRLLHLAFGP